jgi:hypothetical protein
MNVGKKEYYLTRYQASVIKVLHDQNLKGILASSEEFLQAETKISSKIKDVFKGSDAWNQLIVPGPRRGTYRLNIPK